MSETLGARISATLRELVWRPGAVTRAALDRPAPEFVPVGRVLAAFAVAFFVMTYAQNRQMTEPSPEVMQACADSESTSLLGSLMNAASSPDVAASPEAAQVLQTASAFLCDPAPLTRAFALAVPLGFLILMPYWALLMALVFRRQARGFRLHWRYGVETHAALFGLLVLLAAIAFVGGWFVNLLASLAGLWYATWNLTSGVQRAYGVPRREAFWRSTVAGVCYVPVLAVLSLVLMWVQLR